MAYRGYSYSDPVDPSEEGLKKDADAILELLSDPAASGHPKLAKYINKQLIFAQGRSLGGAVAIYMVNQRPELFRGLIVENAFSSISDIADHLFWYVKPFKKYLQQIFWDNTLLVPNLPVPIYFVTGDQDELVPYKQT